MIDSLIFLAIFNGVFVLDTVSVMSRKASSSAMGCIHGVKDSRTVSYTHLTLPTKA